MLSCLTPGMCRLFHGLAFPSRVNLLWRGEGRVTSGTRRVDAVKDARVWGRGYETWL